KKAKAARKAVAAKTASRGHAASAPRKLELVTPPPTLKLDLACGQSCPDGYEGVDLPGTRAVMERKLHNLRQNGGAAAEIEELAKGAERLKHEVNLMTFPWPWKDNSVAELRCSLRRAPGRHHGGRTR